ncbi:hypothetical protein PPERSA_09777 [Pseudocohnilembus persalinus]|uniref:EF-hand domain-containing protein n=1 Tax=Pseudocohnilembus persalinus TaxID=266149 RepID=A0A0V0QUV2_PSEPJ|nr:hypothetical protein PPERSA_09777 [Pseudocohnilembus persalinus]|eukprot:KRX05637.1 hypothetical protein PPERSA_09777 [Pseudocohnilembus persalinus]
MAKFQLVDEARYGGLFTPQQLDQLSQKLMKYYDGNGDGVIENMEVRNMMSDCYRSINKEFKPTATDLVQYTRVITRRTDQHKITASDIRSLASKFFEKKDDVNYASGSGGLEEVARRQGFTTTQSQYQQQTHQYQQSSQYQQSQQQQQPKYTQKVEERLGVARRLFQKIDADNSGYITEDEVPRLLQETYAQMGINNYQPSSSDVKSWMAMTDTNGDGKVSLEEYEALVIRSLERVGIKIQ